MSIKAAQGGFKGYHNYYVSDEFFRRNHTDGVLHTRDGQRAAQVSEAFIAGLHEGLEREVGQASHTILYRTGLEWARRDMPRFERRMLSEYGAGNTDIWEMNRRFVLETWWWALTASGWGAWRLVDLPGPEGLTRIDLRDSVVADSMPRMGAPVCHIYAGLFAGCFEHMDRGERSAVEIQCRGMGAEACIFMVGRDASIRELRGRQSAGATAAELLERLP